MLIESYIHQFLVCKHVNKILYFLLCQNPTYTSHTAVCLSLVTMPSGKTECGITLRTQFYLQFKEPRTKSLGEKHSRSHRRPRLQKSGRCVSWGSPGSGLVLEGKYHGKLDTRKRKTKIKVLADPHLFQQVSTGHQVHANAKKCHVPISHGSLSFLGTLTVNK